MAAKLLIAVSARQVSAARWKGRGFQECDIFTYSDDGLAAFKEYLAPIRDLPVQIMVDAVEEDYRVESLPHSFGRDRAQMVNRKLKQHYRNTPYASGQLQGRDPGKRRDDRYLFCALTNPDLITEWVRAVVTAEHPVAGIYLLPTVSQGLVQKLHLKQTNLLLVSTESSGLRLTFLREQQLRISRLARIDTTGPQAIKNYAQEISNTRIYLHTLRIMALDEQLSVLIIDSDDSLGELSGVVARDNPNLDLKRLGRAEIIERIGISARALDSSADALYLHLLGLEAPASNLAPPDVTQGYRHYKARRGIYALAGGTALAIAALAAFSWYQISDINSDIKVDIAAAASQTEQLRREYAETTRQLPPAPTSAENMRKAVEISQKLSAGVRTPESMMAIVSTALERNPPIHLKGLGWKYGSMDIDAEGGQTKQAEAAPAQPGVNPLRYESGLIDGAVRPFQGDYRYALDAINRFAATLLQQPGVAEVRVIRLPLNISPTLTLSGNTTESRDGTGQAEFKLLLVMKKAA